MHPDEVSHVQQMQAVYLGSLPLLVACFVCWKECAPAAMLAGVLLLCHVDAVPLDFRLHGLPSAKPEGLG